MKNAENTNVGIDPEVSIEDQLLQALERIQTLEKVKNFDAHFSIEHQGMLSAKYRGKYSDADHLEHRAKWPEFVGNHFVMYVLAETLSEARKAVFSANRAVLLNTLVSAMSNYTPTNGTGRDVVMTELQLTFNKTVDMQLNALYEQLPEESNRADLLKAYGKTLKQQAKNGRDMDNAKAKFFHAAAVLGIVPNTIW